jgi:hypothetical protein
MCKLCTKPIGNEIDKYVGKLFDFYTTDISSFSDLNLELLEAIYSRKESWYCGNRFIKTSSNEYQMVRLRRTEGNTTSRGIPTLETISGYTTMVFHNQSGTKNHYYILYKDQK